MIVVLLELRLTWERRPRSLAEALRRRPGRHDKGTSELRSRTSGQV